jgi:hypothetical protein
LRLWPREEAIEESMARALAPGQARRLHAQDTTWDAFVDGLARAGGARTLDAVAERMALREACVRATAGSTWARVAGTRGFVGAAARFVADAERAGLRGRDLLHECRQVRGEVDATAIERLGRLAGVLAHFQELTRAAGTSSAGRLALARELVAGGGALPANELELRPRLSWEPSELALIMALAGRAARVVVELPYAGGREIIDGGLEPVRKTIEARAELESLELVSVDLADAAAEPIRPLVAALYAEKAEPVPETDAVRLVSAPTPAAELRAIAAGAGGPVSF